MCADAGGIAKTIGLRDLPWMLTCVAGVMVAVGSCAREGANSAARGHGSSTVAVREFAIEGMTCEGCVQTVTAAVAKVPGVQRVEVSLEGKRAQVVADPTVVPDSAIESAVAKAGYQARPAKSHQDLPKGLPKP